MRVAVAGATGAVGVPLVRRLREAGHDVVEISRRAGVDVFDRDALRRALASAPDVVVNQLTAWPADRYTPKEMAAGMQRTIRLRVEGTQRLIEAAPGVRMISQSLAFHYRPKDRLHVEDDELWKDGPDPLPASTAALEVLEEATLHTGGVVLRYGPFYGPRTWYAPDGAIAKMLEGRRMPIIGRGRGVASFCHVEDAAAAVLSALEAGTGIYNVVDDDPAPAAVWLPELASTLGAPKPMRVPRSAARVVAGYAVAQFDEFQGASNERFKRDLGWVPMYPTWRGVLGTQER